jgi:hypothetical protein
MSSSFRGGQLVRLVCSVLVLGALIYVIGSLFISAFLEPWQQKSFPMLGTFRMFPPFADLRWVTSLSECGHDLAAVAAGRDPGCDPYHRQGGLGYPAFSVYAARALGLGVKQTGLLGFSFGLTLVLLLVAQVRCLFRSGWIGELLLSLLLLGFPLQLALERANIDLLIYLLLTTLSALLALRGRWTLPLIGLLSFLPVACKVYPVVGLWAWAVQDWFGLRRLRPRTLVVLIGAILGMISALSWLLQYGDKAPDPGEGVLAHGFVTSTLFQYSLLLTQLLAHWPGPLNAALLAMIKIVAISLSFLVARGSGLNLLWRQFLATRCSGYSRSFLEIYVVLMTSTWLGCYLFSSSFDYRLIFAFPALIVCVALIASPMAVKKPLGFLFELFILSLPLVFLPTLLLIANGTKAILLPLGVVNVIILLADYLSLPIVAGLFLAMILPGHWVMFRGSSLRFEAPSSERPTESLNISIHLWRTPWAPAPKAPTFLSCPPLNWRT